jgi:hypothetical protein
MVGKISVLEILKLLHGKACGCGGAGMPCRPAMFPILTTRRGCRQAFSATKALMTNETTP